MDQGRPLLLKSMRLLLDLLKIKLHSLELRGLNLDFERAFYSAAKERAGAIILIRSGVLISNMSRIANLAIKNRVPSMNESSDFVEAGGLVSYSANETENYRRVAVYRRQNPERRQACRPPGRAADEVRVCYQSKNREADRPHNSAQCVGKGGQGH